jgi:hypothetical protein
MLVLIDCFNVSTPPVFNETSPNSFVYALLTTSSTALNNSLPFKFLGINALN